MSDLTPAQRAEIVASRAEVKYGPYASTHEAYAVIVEEYEEFVDEAHKIAGHATELFKHVRSNDVGMLVTRIVDIRNAAERAANEAIDVMAVCDRIIKQYGVKE